ncbi:MAG TPA: lamin tail domain-containing protein [Candidatus Nanoarchaeia archaeon]|nr:lamin tail domain-containing protein [Candidatus Nanoarchaeia archaeon]
MLLVRLVLLFLLFPSVIAGLEINEVMYSPNDGNEWVEIYNPTNQTINLSNWNFIDNKNTDALQCCSFDSACSLMLQPLSYALITDQDTTLYGSLQTNALKICVDDNSLGNGLSNSGDTVIISNNVSETSMSYDSSIANKNNKSLELDSYTWRESYIFGGTPGSINSVALVAIQESSNSTNITSPKSEILSPIPDRIDPTFEILNLSSKITAGEEVNLKISIDSGSLPHEFIIWSYIYSGSKCISCGSGTRETNQQILVLEAHEEKDIFFNLDTSEEVAGGDYKLKVKILKDDQKTPREINREISIKEKELPDLVPKLEEKLTLKEEVKETLPSTTELAQEKISATPTRITGTVVYQSRSKEVQKLIPYFLFLVIALLAVIHVLKIR